MLGETSGSWTDARELLREPAPGAVGPRGCAQHDARGHQNHTVDEHSPEPDRCAIEDVDRKRARQREEPHRNQSRGLQRETDCRCRWYARIGRDQAGLDRFVHEAGRRREVRHRETNQVRTKQRCAWDPMREWAERQIAGERFANDAAELERDEKREPHDGLAHGCVHRCSSGGRHQKDKAAQARNAEPGAQPDAERGCSSGLIDATLGFALGRQVRRQLQG